MLVLFIINIDVINNAETNNIQVITKQENNIRDSTNNWYMWTG